MEILTRKSDPKYDEDLVNKRYIDNKLNNKIEMGYFDITSKTVDLNSQYFPDVLQPSKVVILNCSFDGGTTNISNKPVATSFLMYRYVQRSYSNTDWRIRDVFYTSGAIYTRDGVYNGSTWTWSSWGKELLSTDVVNNLTSTSTVTPLSAAQGKVLNDRITAETNAYMIVGYNTDASVLAGGTNLGGMTVRASKNMTYSGNTVTFTNAGIYQIRGFCHITTGASRSFLIAHFGPSDKVGTLCPVSLRSTDIQNLLSSGDPCYELVSTIIVQAGTTMALEIYNNGNTTLRGSTAYGPDYTHFEIFKIGEYPV